MLVTGASSGIGRETAVLLSSLKATLVITGRNQQRLEETLGMLSGTGHRAEVCDLSQAESIPNWLRNLAAEVGPFKGLVHAAGKQITTPIRFASHPAAADLLNTNLHSAIMLMRGFTQKACHTPESAVVFISSVTGLVGRSGISVYSASKAALIGLARSLAVELAPEGIRVNCVAPGFVRTEMLAELEQVLLPGQLEALEKQHPLGFGSPRDVANAVAFLLSDMARWITGTALVIDGGYSAL